MSCCSNRIFLVVSGCLVVGAVAGYFTRITLGSPDAESVPNAPVAVAPVSERKAPPAAAGENAECRKLQEKAKRLERELDGIMKSRKHDKRGKPTDGSDDSATVGEAKANCKTYGEWKRRYPKSYEDERKRFSNLVTRRLGNYEKWRQFLSSVDVSGLTDEDRRAHGELMETFARVHELLKENLDSMEDDERTLEQNFRSIREIEMLEKKGYELMAKERGILAGAVAENLGRRLGWQGEDVAVFAETLKAIAEVTAVNPQR